MVSSTSHFLYRLHFLLFVNCIITLMCYPKYRRTPYSPTLFYTCPFSFRISSLWSFSFSLITSVEWFPVEATLRGGFLIFELFINPFVSVVKKICLLSHQFVYETLFLQLFHTPLKNKMPALCDSYRP